MTRATSAPFSAPLGPPTIASTRSRAASGSRAIVSATVRPPRPVPCAAATCRRRRRAAGPTGAAAPCARRRSPGMKSGVVDPGRHDPQVLAGRLGRARPAGTPPRAWAPGCDRLGRSPPAHPPTAPGARAPRLARASSSSPCPACGTKPPAVPATTRSPLGPPTPTTSSDCARCRNPRPSSWAMRRTPPRNSGKNRGRSALGTGMQGPALTETTRIPGPNSLTS